MARLTTHVLDTSHGTPAAGIAIDLYVCDSGRTLLGSTTTGADGRTAEVPDLAPGIYELVFHAGQYFRAMEDPPFLGDVVVRFGISEAAGKYHVPLLLSPYGYSVYRGS